MVYELSHAMGRPLYNFNCTKNMDSNILHDIFKGFASTGKKHTSKCYQNWSFQRYFKNN